MFNGEGDGLPGLICDLYADSAVLKLDGDGPAGFYDVAAISQLLQQHWRLRTTYLKYKAGSQVRGMLVLGGRAGGVSRTAAAAGCPEFGHAAAHMAP